MHAARKLCIVVFLLAAGAFADKSMMGSGDDQALIQKLVQNRAKIERTVTNTDKGVETRTWSADAEVGLFSPRRPESAFLCWSIVHLDLLNAALCRWLGGSRSMWPP